MKKYFRISIFIISALVSTHFSYSQGVAVNTTGNTADPSAMLDVNATNKGILIPRVTSTSSITSPVVGLLIFQTTVPIGFYYYDGATWDYLQNSANANVTLQGNTFNGNSQLLQLNSTGQIPALSGVNITNLNASNITSGTVPAANGGAGTVTGILYANGSGTVTAATTANFPTLNQSTTGNAATVTTDANLTGDITSVGNATTYNNIVPANKGGAGTTNGILEANGAGTVSAANTTGSGNVVLATSPTLVTPNLGTPSTLIGTNISGTAAGLTAGNVTTDANLTGAVTSVGNATSYNTIVPIAKGGTGTATPALVAGTNVTLSGTWPNETINATSGGGSSGVKTYNWAGCIPINNTAATAYVGLGTDLLSTASGIDVATPISGTCTLDSFYVHGSCIVTAISGTNVYTGTIYKNGANTGITATITLPSTATVHQSFSASDVAHSISVVPGDTIYIIWTQSNYTNGAIANITYGLSGN
jgi:hypothetical protein